MRPILLELGPWSPWVIAVVAAGLVAVLAIWTWLERRGGQPVAVTPTEYAAWGGFAVVLAAALYYAVNRWGPLHIRSYGVMLTLGLAAGIAWLYHDGRRLGSQAPWVVDFALVVLVVGFGISPCSKFAVSIM